MVFKLGVKKLISNIVSNYDMTIVFNRDLRRQMNLHKHNIYSQQLYPFLSQIRQNIGSWRPWTKIQEFLKLVQLFI